MEGFDGLEFERHEHAVYGLKPDLTVAYLNPAWFEFARRNGGESIREYWGLGSNVLDATTGPARALYEDLFHSCLETGRPRRQEYECSSIAQVRCFHMVVYPIRGRRGLLVINSIFVDHPRSRVPNQVHRRTPLRALGRGSAHGSHSPPVSSSTTRENAVSSSRPARLAAWSRRTFVLDTLSRSASARRDRPLTSLLRARGPRTPCPGTGEAWTAGCVSGGMDRFRRGCLQVCDVEPGSVPQGEREEPREGLLGADVDAVSPARRPHGFFRIGPIDTDVPLHHDDHLNASDGLDGEVIGVLEGITVERAERDLSTALYVDGEALDLEGDVLMARRVQELDPGHLPKASLDVLELRIATRTNEVGPEEDRRDSDGQTNRGKARRRAGPRRYVRQSATMAAIRSSGSVGETEMLGTHRSSPVRSIFQQAIFPRVNFPPLNLSRPILRAVVLVGLCSGMPSPVAGQQVTVGIL